nr:YSIRK-type signal peptide-containing protein [Streptococcus suis]
MKKKETFSLRKYKIGTVSVLLGAVFFVCRCTIGSCR